MLSEPTRKKLEEENIRIFDYAHMVILSKKIGAKGNLIPNFKGAPVIIYDKEMNVQEEVFSDCPKVSMKLEDNKFIVSVWDWVPGPGPGDFELSFDNEEEAVREARNYFFGESKYFKKRLEYHLQG